MGAQSYRPERLLLAVALSLGGCVTLPDRETVAPLLPVAVPGLSSVETAAGGGWPAARWWNGWGDPGLTEAVEKGIAGSPDVAAAVARFGRAEGMARAAGGVSLPSVGVGADASRTRQSDNGMLPTEFFDNPYTDYRLAASLSYDLSFWGAGRKEAEGYIREADAARFEAEGVRRALAVAIAQAYYAAGLARQERALADDGLAVSRNLYDLVALRVEKGLASRVAERRAFALVAQAREERADADRRLTLARNRLAALVGEGPDAGAALDRAPDLTTVPVAPLPVDLPVGLLARRPDLLALMARVEGAGRREGAAEARFYPDLNLAAFVGYQSLTLDTLFDAGSLTWSAGPAIRLPLFMGGRLRGGLRAARAGYDEAVARYHGRVVEVARQVADRLADLKGARSRADEQARSLAAHEEAEALARLRYERGLDDFRSPLEAEERLLTQRRIALRLRGEGIGATLGLIDALGGGFGE